jgi:hypothetical protein
MAELVGPQGDEEGRSISSTYEYGTLHFHLDACSLLESGEWLNCMAVFSWESGVAHPPTLTHCKGVPDTQH